MCDHPHGGANHDCTDPDRTGRGGPELSRRRVLGAAAATGGWWAVGRPGVAGADGGSAVGHVPEALAMGEDPPVVSAAAVDDAVPTGRTRVPVAAPAIFSRAQWGADETLRTSARSFSPIRKLIVHHTATSNAVTDWAAELRSIYRYHVVGRAYADIAYNFLIDPNGGIWEGRWSRDHGGAPPTGEDPSGRGVVGAHTLNYNTGTCGVALLGTYSGGLPSPAAREALVRVLAWKAGRHGIDATASDPFTRFDGTVDAFPNLLGHRDLGQTECPGGPLHAWLPALRQAVAARARAGLIGYRVLGADGSVTSFAGAGDQGSPRALGARNVRAIAASADPQGYWVLGADGGVFAFGTARYHGSVPGLGVRTTSVDLASTAGGGGYWILGRDGGIFCFGDAVFHGSLGDVTLNAPPVRIRATPTGRGYWILGGDGGVFCFGDARFFGSLGGLGVTTPTVDLLPTPSGRGYWLLGADGGVFCFGDARFFGSVPGLGVRWSAPAVALAGAPEAAGYHVLASDGGVFTFGELPFHGSTAGSGVRPLGLAPAVQPAG